MYKKTKTKIKDRNERAHNEAVSTARSLSFSLTCDADCLLDDDPDAPDDACMAEVCLRYSTSLKTFLSPPPALCFTLARDPTLLSTFTSTFSWRI